MIAHGGKPRVSVPSPSSDNFYWKLTRFIFKNFSDENLIYKGHDEFSRD